MFVIDLKSADGTSLPFQLELEPHDSSRAQVQVTHGTQVLSEAVISYEKIPLASRDRDIRVGNMGLGFEPLLNRLLVEFGDDPRLGVVPANEVRSALSVCRCYDSVMKN